MAITPLSRRKNSTYSDFHKDLTLNPINLDLARRVDEEAIKESVKNLILTDRGERLFQPNVGCNIRYILFENAGPETAILAKQLITETISAYEPRANIINIDVVFSVDLNNAKITITFNVINKEEPITFNVTLDRVH